MSTSIIGLGVEICSHFVGSRLRSTRLRGIKGGVPQHCGARAAGGAHSLRSASADGYDGMVEGATFANAQINAAVVIGAAPPNMGEQAGHAATLTVTMCAATQAYEGAWKCGP